MTAARRARALERAMLRWQPGAAASARPLAWAEAHLVRTQGPSVRNAGGGPWPNLGTRATRSTATAVSQALTGAHTCGAAFAWICKGPEDTRRRREGRASAAAPAWSPATLLPAPAPAPCLRRSSQKFEDPAEGEEALKAKFQALNEEIRDRFHTLEEEYR